MKDKKNINDPYRWLEKDSRKTRVWLKAQELRAEHYFAGDKNIKILEKKLDKLFHVDTIHLPVIRNGLYFFRYKKFNEEQPSIYLKKGINGTPHILVDMNKLSKKYGSINDWSVSKDARFISIEFSKSSNDRCFIRIFDIKKKIFLPDVISETRYPYFSVWKNDSSGFWYIQGDAKSKPGEEKYNKKVYFHKLGEPISKDRLFFSAGLSREDWPSLNCSDDGKYFFIHVHQKDNNSRILFADGTKNKLSFLNITMEIKGKSSARIDADNEYIYLETDFKAPKGCVLRRKIINIESAEWETFVPEAIFNLETWNLTKNYLFLEYLVNVSSRLFVVNLKTKKKQEIKLPGLGSVLGYSSRLDSKELFFSFASFNVPLVHYRLDLDTLKYKKYWGQKIPTNPKNIVVKQEWSKSKDGTKIPMFIVYKKGLKLNKSNPALVYAYGGFNASITPSFTPSIIPFIQDGGVYVSANIRGGNEFGDQWNKSVILKKRYKCFEDFASVLVHLTKRKYTNPEKIGIRGASNGGLLVSVIMLRYPNLFKTALVSVPVTDMLRFHLFDGGKWWISEYGDPENESMRKYLLTYSPYHNVKDFNYPSALFMTSDHDDRVRPMHSYKMVARLNENKNQKNPIILNIEKNSGHSGSGSITPFIKKTSEMFAFLYKELGM